MTPDDEKTSDTTDAAVKPTAHKKIAGALVDYVAVRGFAFDAVGGIRDEKSWAVVNQSVPTLARDFAYKARFQYPVRLSYAIETLESIADRAALDRRRIIVDEILRMPTMEEGKAELHRWLVAVTGRDDATDFGVVLHWIWLVKRGLAHLDPEHHIMPILSGRQGSGKTTAMRKLLGPLAELVLMPCDASILTDSKRVPALGTFAVAVLDELQGVSRADAEALKQTLTAETRDYRPMRTNSIAVVPVRCRFMGATNEPVQGLVNDTTGMRRFYDLACQDEIDRGTVNEITYPLLWAAVSQHDAAPILSHLGEVQKRQEKLKKTDSISEWLDAEDWKCAPYMIAKGGEFAFDSPGVKDAQAHQFNPGDWLGTDVIRSLYIHFCEDKKEPVMGLSAWGRRLKGEGFHRAKRKRTRPDGAEIFAYGYILPARRGDAA